MSSGSPAGTQRQVRPMSASCMTGLAENMGEITPCFRRKFFTAWTVGRSDQDAANECRHGRVLLSGPGFQRRRVLAPGPDLDVDLAPARQPFPASFSFAKYLGLR